MQNIKNTIIKSKIIPIIREKTYDDGLKKAIIVAKSGVKIIEITYTTPEATNIIKQIKKQFPDILIGAGSVVVENDVRDAIDGGSDFIVSPGFSEIVSNICKQNEILYIPGSITPSEITKAFLSGWDLIKLFPLSFLDKNYIKNISSAMPYIKFMGTGGVNLENINKFKEMNIDCFGLGSSLTEGTEEQINSRIKKLFGGYLNE